MPKSLEEIKKEFENKKSVQTKELPIKEVPTATIGAPTVAILSEVNNISVQDKKQTKPKSSAKKMAIISDVIFAVALIMMGACALILSYGETGVQVSSIYRFINERREIALIIFATLIVLSFFLRFSTQKREERDEVEE